MVSGSLLMLGLLLLCWFGSLTGYGQEAAAGDYEVLWSKSSSFGFVQVVRMEVNSFLVDFMLCDKSVVGAQFVEEDLREHTLFPIFSLLASARFLQPKPARAMILGLGAGMVPSILRGNDIHTDVVEINPAIVEAAVEHFGYRQSSHAQSTIIADVRDLATGERPADAPKYDLIIHDLYSGSALATTFTQHVFLGLRDLWLKASGVLIVNFLGSASPRSAAELLAFGAAVAKTLRSVFRRVNCYREVPLTYLPENCNNILCFCSAHSWKLQLPAEYYGDAVPEMSPEWIVGHFQEWEVFGAGDAHHLQEGLSTEAMTDNVGVINETTASDYRRAGDLIAAKMLKMTQTQIMPNPGFWRAMRRETRVEALEEL